MELSVGCVIGPLRVDFLANGGAGIARWQGRVLFVPQALPGDLIRCRIRRLKKRYADADLVELLEPSSVRLTPPCPVAEECGGCQWQALDYAQQLQWKEKLFHETLSRHCAAEPQQLLPIVPSPQQWNYRSRVQIKCSRTAEGFVTGFYRPRSHLVVAMEGCPVIAEELNELLPRLRESIDGSPYAGEIPQIDLAIGDDGARRVLVHYLGSKVSRLAELLAPLRALDAVSVLIKSEKRQQLHALSGDGVLRIEVGEPPLTLSYAVEGFAQINLQQNRQLVDAVLSAAQLTGRERVLDLFCGMGNFSLPLALSAESLIGVEDYAPSIRMARSNARALSIQNTSFYTRSADGALSTFAKDRPFDLILLDPPRSGARQVMRELHKYPARRILYVSCDPQTLARDLKILLQDDYCLVSSMPFDMFPHTFHCESLTVLERRSALL